MREVESHFDRVGVSEDFGCAIIGVYFVILLRIIIGSAQNFVEHTT